MLPIPPVIVAVAAGIGVYALARALASEWRRINHELHAAGAPVDGEPARTLKRDPRTGVYRAE